MGEEDQQQEHPCLSAIIHLIPWNEGDRPGDLGTSLSPHASLAQGCSNLPFHVWAHFPESCCSSQPAGPYHTAGQSPSQHCRTLLLLQNSQHLPSTLCCSRVDILSGAICTPSPQLSIPLPATC